MCGICGFTGRSKDELIERMTDSMVHRGPDARGTHIEDRVSLGQRRLSIIDPSPQGNQPMCNEDGSLWLVYNGEIYNFREIRQRLLRAGHRFRSDTDTEVVLHAYEEYGEACLDEFNGMFAFALWNRPLGRLMLARDRLGVKPLYYMQLGKILYFASELKPLCLVPGFNPEVNPVSLDRYLTYRYVTHTDETMISGIKRLLPARKLIFEAGEASIQRYWYLPELQTSRDMDPREAGEQYRALFEDSVRLRLMSDVPLGVYLSGGVDSSAVLGMMARLGQERIKTFSIGYGTGIDELDSARKVAAHFGTDHSETLVESNDLHILEKVVGYLNEPVGDAIILPMYLLAGMAGERVKTVLTGEGADETLGGYIHHLTLTYGELFKRGVPGWISRNLLRGIKAVPDKVLDWFFLYPANLGKEGKNKLLGYLSDQGNLFNNYLGLVSLFSSHEKSGLYNQDLAQTLGSRNDEQIPLVEELEQTQGCPLNRVIRHDLQTWLPDQILFKLDRITMAHSIEGRVPFLDHRLVEFTTSLTGNLKIRRLETKVLLRRACRGLLPREVVRRKKKAFFMPVEDCFGDNFFRFVTDVLSRESVRKRGYFQYENVHKLIERYRANPRELLYSKQVMALVILELWHRSLLDAAA